MYSNKIYFPQRHSPEWKDFVKVSLEKNPHQRPSAATLLNHPWIRYAYPGGFHSGHFCGHYIHLLVDRAHQLLWSLADAKAACRADQGKTDTMTEGCPCHVNE